MRTTGTNAVSQVESLEWQLNKSRATCLCSASPLQPAQARVFFWNLEVLRGPSLQINANLTRLRILIST